MRIEDIACICHEANRVYCLTFGDHSQQVWMEMPQGQRDSTVKGVQFVIDNPLADPKACHVSWLKLKEETGWKYGPVWDDEKKEHPCFVPYYDLPIEQRRKDHIFWAIVRACIGASNEN